MQAALDRFCCRGKTRHETATAACWPRRKNKRISAVVANVIAPVHRSNYPAETFFFDRAKKVAWISSAVQSGLCYWCRIESAFGCKTRLHGRVVKRADDEVFATVSLRTPREFFIFLRQTLHDFGPRNVGSNIGQNRQRTSERDATRNQSAKSDSIGPPISISMGRRFHSYSYGGCFH